ncbi:7498_t:CDS:2, partial [Scutellospora calospora]
MIYAPVIINIKNHNLQKIVSFGVIWILRSQVLPTILYQDYTKKSIEEDEIIILRNCYNFLYTSQAQANINAIHQEIRENIYNLLRCRTAGSNLYTNYRHLQGLIKLSKNKYAFELHSSLIEAFLNHEESSNWFYPSLLIASQWLKNNNPLFEKYNQACMPLQFPISNDIHQTFLTARPVNTSTNAESTRPLSLIIPNKDFPNEIHNEDYRYECLIAEFLETNNDLTLPIPNYDPDIESLLFPDLFSTGHYHYEDSKNLLDFKQNIDSYSKYIKLQLLSDLIIASTYTNKPIINESLTTTLPSHIRTSDSFFRKKQYQQGHINFQYVTTFGFRKYVTKYATKPEPTEIFDIMEQDSYKKHVQARILGSIELMILFLQYSVTRSSAAIKFLPSALSELQIRS